MATVPAGIDPHRANPARIYDLMLGGKDHYASDRQAAARVLAAAPQVRDAVRENRRFLQRAVHHLAAEQGMCQFIDVGCGLPTAGNVHEIAQALVPDARVVYVDRDPVVLVHGRAPLATNRRTTVIDGDARDPAGILNHPDLRAAIDVTKPVAVLLVGILHFLTDDEAARTLAGFRAAMVSGSLAVISHATTGRRPMATGRAARIYSEAATGITLRTARQIHALAHGFEFTPPGLVPAARWRPDLPSHIPPGDHPTRAPVLAGIAHPNSAQR